MTTAKGGGFLSFTKVGIMTEQEKALYSVIFRLNGDCKDTVNACIEELLDISCLVYEEQNENRVLDEEKNT
jgi:hypothetical protein